MNFSPIELEVLVGELNTLCAKQRKRATNRLNEEKMVLYRMK